MLTIIYQSRFKKDAKRYTKNKNAQKVILATISLLQTGEALPKIDKEHPLIGNYIGYLECHGMPDLLFIYQRTDPEIKLYRMGSHSDLF
ncbi:type II toxin-antitoxin system RelE/ParE family toxin [Yersinia pekkanenii]|uniref:mRNA interferase YafQ n=1 Tax=Yersinia pekkanenii TaxID=1288385 RepID=A0A0T9NEC2_9GAMM|nr:type II toxin-antitoxin system YafQ family toxin [Yersinia pekkanenii]CNH02399.1 mRNA interferase YafQ [Yersinia pekkanenii]CRY63976.1 mRNA interferase YafQ [Yersinia pekkanenii]